MKSTNIRTAGEGNGYRQARTMMLDTAIRFLSFMKQFAPSQQAARRRCEEILDVPYMADGNNAHRLDIVRPKTQSGLLPVLMYIHGGGFALCSKDTHRGLGLIYAARGYLVFNINYRLSPKFPFPAALEDVAAAYQWIVEYAAACGGDPNRIIVSGESAGANLALALTISSCFRRHEPAASKIWKTGVVPRVCMPMCGMLQVSHPQRLKHVSVHGSRIPRTFGTAVAEDVSKAYLGREYRTPRHETALADPLLVMESNAIAGRPLPSFYAMAGTADILIDDTRRLERALYRRGVRNVVRYYPNQGHAFHLVGTGSQAKEFWHDHLTFLSREMARQHVLHQFCNLNP